MTDGCAFTAVGRGAGNSAVQGPMKLHRAALSVHLAALCTLLLCAACTPPAPPALPLQSEDFTLRGVPVDIDSVELRLTFGDPDSIIESPNPYADTVPLTTWVYDGFEARFAGPASPIGYMIVQPGESTARGLSVGDPTQRMQELYGEPSVRIESGWIYSDTTHASELRVIMTFVQADTVRRIYLGWAIR
jgi:hypothetical protein